MNSRLQELLVKFKQVESEAAYHERKRREDAQAVVNFLHGIKDEELVILRKYIPNIDAVVSYTPDQILTNENGEATIILNSFNTLMTVVETALKHYGEQL